MTVKTLHVKNADVDKELLKFVIKYFRKFNFHIKNIDKL